MFDVSVLIVCWNSEKFISGCLESIYRFSKNCSFEIIVIDNASSDRTVEIIPRDFPEVQLVQAGKNLGFASATNMAMRLACGRFLFMLNPDIQLESDVIGELVRFLEAHPEAGGACPKVLEKDGSIAIYSARGFPTIGSAFFTFFGLRKLFPRSPMFSKETIPNWDRQTVRQVPYISGAAFMIPRSVLRQIGFLDEQLPMYYEDLEICARINTTNKALYYVPSAILTHIWRQSADISPVRPLLFAMEKGQAPWLYFRTYRGPVEAKIFFLITCLGNLLRLLLLAPLYPLSFFFKTHFLSNIKQDLSNSAALFQWSCTSEKIFQSWVSSYFNQEWQSPAPAFPKVNLTKEGLR